LDQVENLTGTRPKDCYVNLGYRGNNESRCEVHLTRSKHALRTYTLRRDMRRRSAIEPIIGHMKSDGLLGRNYLKGIGDKINALLCGVGYDLRIILRRLKLLWLKIFWVLYKNFISNLLEYSFTVLRSELNCINYPGIIGMRQVA
jgi:hypothetical protein